MASPPIARHDLLSVPPQAWRDVLAAGRRDRHLTREAESLLATWAAAGRPAVARRAAPGGEPGAVAVGVPLPPAFGKARVALSVPANVRLGRRDAVYLDEACFVAPPAWRAALDAVVALGSSLGLRPRVFGALLWRAVTGLDYLHARSDLDLLWPAHGPERLPALLDGLTRVEAEAPFRIDGEVSIAGAEVNWRELDAARRGAASEVLVKALDRAGLATLDAFLSGRPFA